MTDSRIIAAFTLLTALVLSQNPACAQKPVMPFDPDKSVLLSDPANKMTHCPSTVITDDGEVYFTYYYDKAQAKELGIATSTEIGLDHFPLKKWKKPQVERQLVMKYGMTVGDFTQYKYPPYDPALIDIGGDKFALLFQGCRNDDEGKAFFRMQYDRRSGRFEEKVDACLLHYNGKSVTISNQGLSEAFRDITGETLEKVETPVINQQFFKDGGWWYNAVTSFCSPQSRPLIVRTKDFINYEMLFVCREFTKGASETSVAIHNGEMYILARSCRPESGMGCYMAKYSMDGKCLSKPCKVSEIESRQVLTVYKGKLYAFYNAGPNLVNEKGKVSRSRMRISEIDNYARPVNGWDISSYQSIQYFNVIEHKGKLYMTFVSGRTPRDYRQFKGDISFGELNM